MTAMMVVGLADIALGIAGIGMMIPGLLPQKADDPSHHTKVRVNVGIYGDSAQVKESNMGGDFPDIRLYDKRGDYIGTNGKQNPHLDAGGFKEVSINHEKGTDGRQSEYMAVSASGDDAICINYITITWPDDTSFGFLGDVGSMCGADWYYSDKMVTNQDSTSTEAPMVLNRTSNCMWIDKNGSENIKNQGFAFHIPDFSSSKDVHSDGRAKQYAHHKDTMCSSAPRFKTYGKMNRKTKIPVFWPPLNYTDDNADADLKAVTNNPGKLIPKTKRGMAASDDDNLVGETERPLRRRRVSPLTVVKSSIDQHNATRLCNSENSRGPDFVSLSEGIFCDMDQRQVWPVCSNEHPHGCFDDRTNSMRAAPHGRRHLFGREVPDKSYENEIVWGHTQG